MTVATRSGSTGRPVGGAMPTRSRRDPVGSTVPPVPFEHEELVIRRGARSGAEMIVAIHSTALGPALGGIRLWHYSSPMDASRDALRLAKGMTMKAAAAGLDLGGGKGVICAPGGGLKRGAARTAALRDFADLVDSLDGRYITAEDVGICPEDMVVMRERTRHVTGLPPALGGSGDPSPFTAAGVEAAMRACVRERFGSSDLAGRRVTVIGLGHVGAGLARRLVACGARLAVSDIDPAKHAVARALDAAWLEPDEALRSECDVLAPCALGGAIDASTAEALRSEIVCGAANNQLADESLAASLADRGILVAPDFIVNAGGLINVFREIRGYGPERALEMALGIESTMDRVLEVARVERVTPLDAARAMASRRLRGARTGSGSTPPA